MNGEPSEIDVEQSVTSAVTDPLASQPDGVEVRVISLEQSPDCAAAPRLTAQRITAEQDSASSLHFASSFSHNSTDP